MLRSFKFFAKCPFPRKNAIKQSPSYMKEMNWFLQKNSISIEYNKLKEKKVKNIQMINSAVSNSQNVNQDNNRLNLDRFHHIKEGKITGPYDFAIVQHIMETQNLFILGRIPYLYDQGVYRCDFRGTKVQSLIKKCLYPQFIKASVIRQIYDLLINTDEIQADYDDLNQYPAHWVNFKNGFFDPISETMKPHDPKYMAMNQVAASYEPNHPPYSGFELEKWFNFTVENPDDREMLLEFCGYCMTRDTSQQKFMILFGRGGTGKSTLIRLLETAIGRENVSNTSLSELSQKFASFCLMGKLLNSCADLEVGLLKDTSMLKKILGEDTLRGEAKGKDAIFFKNHAKLIFSTNELPDIRNEHSNGFYRRLLILQMNKIPITARADLFEHLTDELPYFIHLCMQALSRMYRRGSILESQNSKTAVQQMQKDSDTVEAFLQEWTKRVPGARAEKSAIFSIYVEYCLKTERRHLGRTTFFKALRSKLGEPMASNGIRYYPDIELTKAHESIDAVFSTGCG